MQFKKQTWWPILLFASLERSETERKLFLRTEALLEALSSSLLVGGTTPFLERGDEAGAFLLDFRGFA